jgi:hypothetical protein
MNPFQTAKTINQQLTPQQIQAEIEKNPIVRLQMSDKELINDLSRNPDPKQAEMLMERKMRSIGMNDKEIIVVLMCDVYKYPVEKALQETGLDKEQLDQIYDNGINKINSALKGNGMLSNVKNVFK